MFVGDSFGSVSSDEEVDEERRVSDHWYLCFDRSRRRSTWSCSSLPRSSDRIPACSSKSCFFANLRMTEEKLSPSSFQDLIMLYASSERLIVFDAIYVHRHLCILLCFDGIDQRCYHMQRSPQYVLTGKPSSLVKSWSRVISVRFVFAAWPAIR